MNPIIFNQNFIELNKINELKNLINFNEIEKEFQESHFYDNKTKSLIVNRHIRSSEKIQFRDDIIFDWFENNIINKLNNDIDTNINFMLLRDDIEMIRYRPGDFFKRHVDTINFYSNEFINYTCLINLKQCINGGETLVYIENEEYLFKEIGQNEGSILIFQKQLEHEGKEVIDGEKIIVVANFVAYKKEKNIGDIIIVKIEKTKNIYILPVKKLNNYKNVVYYAFYDFQKKLNPNKKIFKYTESHLTDNEFLVFYNIIYPNTNTMEILDYIGLDKSDIYQDFNNFINDQESKNEFINETQSASNIFMCHMDDYFNLIKMIDCKKILPFQLITFEYSKHDNDWYYGEQKEQITVWFGIYENLFVTCDYNPNRICKVNENYIEDKIIKKSVDKIKECLNSMFIKNAEQFDIYGGYKYLKENDKEILNEIIWNMHGLKKMEEITFSNYVDPFIQINKYIIKMMKDIENINASGDGYKSKNSSICYQLKLDPLYKLNKYEKIQESSNLDNLVINESIDLDHIKNIDMIQLLKKLKGIKMTSDIKRSNTSREVSCNAVQYTMYDVVYKFGFIKIDELEKCDRIDIDKLILDYNPDIKKKKLY